MQKTPELIVMLTNNDVTVPDAAALFEECRDLPVSHWGFKNVGLPDEAVTALANRMKDCGKTTFFEVVSFTKEAYEQAVRLAVSGRFDYVTGSNYEPFLHEKLQEAGIGYMPFVGKIVQKPGEPGRLTGTREEMLATAREVLAKGVHGIDFSPYRHVSEDGFALAKFLTAALPDAHICIAGSINSFDRIREVQEAGVESYTMGSALFAKAFVPEGSFRDNLAAVVDFMETL